MAQRTFVIADPGNTAGGDLSVMLDLIYHAASVDVDAIKFQWVSDALYLSKRRNAQGYLSAYQQIAFPQDWLSKLRDACLRYGIEFMCTAYLESDLSVLAPLVQRWKISSFEATDMAFFAEHLPYQKPIIVSTGMMSPAEVLWYVKHREDDLPSLRIIHCVSAYPAPLSEMNLGAIRRYSLDGFSDHSRSLDTGALAVAAGATIIETHFRLDEADPNGEDFAHSFTPKELAVYVANIRRAEEMMGTGFKQCQPSEEPMRRFRVEKNCLEACHD